MLGTQPTKICFKNDSGKNLASEHTCSHVKNGVRTRLLYLPCEAGSGKMTELEIRPGLKLHLIDYSLITPITMASDSWPSGFGFVFFISGKIAYRSSSFGREMSLSRGLNRIAFQPKSSGDGTLFPGERIQVVTITMTPSLFTQILKPDLPGLPQGFQRAAVGQREKGFYTVSNNTPAIQMALYRLIHVPSCSIAKNLLYESLILELIALQFQQLSTVKTTTGNDFPVVIEKIQVARDILCKNMESPPLFIDLAHQVGLSPNRLSTAFKEIYGATPFAYLKKMRLNRAQLLLLDSGMNVTEVAFTVGYDSLSHFSKAFQQHFGILPCQLK